MDSGNLLGALWVLDQGLEALMQAPLLDAQAFAGLRDTGESCAKLPGRKEFRFGCSALDELLRAWESPPERVADALGLLRRTEQRP